MKSTLSFLIPFLHLLLLLGLSAIAAASNGPRHTHYNNLHTIQLSSLFPSESCESHSQGTGNEAKFAVVHNHGPCSNHDRKSPTMEEILLADEARVAMIQRKTSASKLHPDATVIPARYGITIGTGNYVVKLGLGTPARQLTWVFDTGSAFSWTQCLPCRSCYQQVDPIFNPSQSSSYSNVSCQLQPCATIASETGFPVKCSGTTCVYGILYGDNSLSFGYLAKEKLTITPTASVSNFYFGCAKINQGLFGMASGLLGLGRSPLSVVSLTAAQYNSTFSYCLPSSLSSVGFLSFGGAGVNLASMRYTPISSSYSPNLYGVDIVGISVRGKLLPIPPSVFTTAKGIIDSGTVISRLPRAAYTAMRDAFKAGMSKYPAAPPVSLLDTCFDLSNFSVISIPAIAFTFKGGATVDLHPKGILYARVRKPSQVCLAFASNDADSDVAIFANVQQKTLEIVYDLPGGRIGFAGGGCG